MALQIFTRSYTLCHQVPSMCSNYVKTPLNLSFFSATLISRKWSHGTIVSRNWPSFNKSKQHINLHDTLTEIPNRCLCLSSACIRASSSTSRELNCNALSKVNSKTGMSHIHNSAKFNSKTGMSHIHNSAKFNIEQEVAGDSSKQLDEEWREFYKLKQIVYLRALSNLKFYNIGISAIFLPVSYKFMGIQSVLFGLYLSVPITLGFILLSHGLTKVIGKMCVDKENQILQVSHLNFWGKKQDVNLNISDVMPLSETPGHRFSKFIPFHTYTNSHHFYVYCSEESVKDPVTFGELLGSVQ